ncbi:transmembrane signal receptor [Lithospermum erythrorhizon]|uniref:Transmembrane signal receptor n=1 Tax=Lithospermum erythrorhizon TaxID=34254 RepID=A0AAV3R9A4_LITER
MRFPISNFVSYNKFSSNHCYFLANITSNVEPRTCLQRGCPRGSLASWCVAMQSEIAALEKNKTWDIVQLPPGKRAIGCQWIFKTMFKSDGAIERHKARLAVLGNHQTEGEGYTDTFAQVAKILSVRTFLLVAIAKNWEVHQLDVNNSFSHGDLHEEVYMKLPPGFTSSSPTQVCRLRKSLYGLLQSPRNWFAKLISALCTYGFTQSHADHTLFTFR